MRAGARSEQAGADEARREAGPGDRGISHGGFVDSIGESGVKPVRGPDRRECPRTAFEGWVELHVDGVRRLTTGCDLSPGGIGLDLGEQPLEGATAVTCEFALPGISLTFDAQTHRQRVGGSRRDQSSGFTLRRRANIYKRKYSTAGGNCIGSVLPCQLRSSGDG